MSVPRPPDLIDRDAEWKSLAAMWGKARADLMFVVGRRRVGKSFLLSRFTRQVGGIYYQATRRTEAEQLAGLSRVIGQHFGDAALQHGISFPTWEDLFRYVAQRADGAPFLLVLDEFPYLAGAAPALPSIIQELWDHDWQGTRIKLVLSGSYITAMNRLEAVDQPLYGRRTSKLMIGSFSFADAARLMPAYPVRDQLVAYGLFGHLPGHLSLVDAERPLAENVAELLLSPTGRLVDEAQHMLDAFTGDAHVHYSIIEAIAGEQTWGGITKRVGRTGGSLLRPLQWLEEMQVIARVAPVSEVTPFRSKRVLYRIVDPYVAFWHRTVVRLVNAGSLGLVEPERLWSEVVAPGLDDYMGPVFEQVCREFVRRNPDRLPFRPLRVGEWWDAASTQQVDVVAVGARGDLLVGECKWGRVTAVHLAALRARADAVAAEVGGIRHVHAALFTGRGEIDDEVRRESEAGAVLLFRAEDLR